MKENSSVTFGIGKELITPREKTSIIGFGVMFGTPYAEIHDDLYVRALLLEDAEEERVLLLSFDLCFHDDSLPRALRDYAAAHYGVKPDHLHVCYTHTHFGPAVKGYDFTYAKESYEAFLLDRAAASIDRAFLNRHRGTMAYSAVAGDWNINRRLPVDGDVLLRPNPQGIADPNLYLLRFLDEEGNLRALLTSFACHPSNQRNADAVSAEYPGRLCALLEAEYYGCTALFFQGFGADSKLRKGAKDGVFHRISHAEIDTVCRSMFHAVKEQLNAGAWRDLPVRLGSTLFTLELPLEILPLDYYIKERDQFRRASGGAENECFRPDPGLSSPLKEHSSELLWACAEYVIAHYDGLPEKITLNCGVIRLNPEFYLFSMGGEPVIGIQALLRNAFPGKQILCFGFNDAIAYIPDDRVLAEGGYEAGYHHCEIEYRLKGRLKSGVDEIFLRGYREAVEEIENTALT